MVIGGQGHPLSSKMNGRLMRSGERIDQSRRGDRNLSSTLSWAAATGRGPRISQDRRYFRTATP